MSAGAAAPASSWVARLRPHLTPARLALASAGALLFLFCESKPLMMNDLGIFLALGRFMAAHGGFATPEPFTHTAGGAPWVNDCWLAETLFFRLWQLGGFALLQMLLAIAVLSAVLLVGLAAGRASGNERAAGGAGLLAAWLMVQNLGLRPQLFALPLFAVYAWLAMARKPDLRSLAASAAIVAVWANLHGSFAIAPVLSALVAGGVAWEAMPRLGSWVSRARALAGHREARIHALTALAAAAASLANPWGWRLYGFVRGNSAQATARGLTEWQRTTIGTPAGIRLAVALAVAALALALGRRFFARRDRLVLLGFTLLALSAVRHVLWMGFVLPIALARVFPEQRDREEARGLPPVLVGVIALFWAVILVQLSPWTRVRAKSGDAEMLARFDASTPIALAAWAADHGVEGNLFNTMEWGSTLAWRLPEDRARLFVDVRIWIFPDDVWSDFVAIANAAPDWQQRLDARQVSFAILDRRFAAPLIAPMSASPSWEKLYEDPNGLIFRRRPPPP